MGFFSLQHLQDSEVRFTRACRARHLPRSGFGYPLRGLRPPSPRRPSFVPTALLGFTLRSLLLSRGTEPFPAQRTHLPFFPPLLPSPERRAGPAGRGFWALTLARIPGGLRLFRAQIRWMLPWDSALPRFSAGDLNGPSPALLSHAFPHASEDEWTAP